MRKPIVLAILLAALSLPLGAQTPDDSFPPDSVEALLWSEGLLTADQVAESIEWALDDDSTAASEGLNESERAARFRRSIVVASHAAAGAATMIQSAVYVSISLSPPGWEGTNGDLSEAAAAAYTSLAGVVDDAADVAESIDPPDDATREHWRGHAWRVRGIIQYLTTQRADALRR